MRLCLCQAARELSAGTELQSAPNLETPKYTLTQLLWGVPTILQDTHTFSFILKTCIKTSSLFQVNLDGNQMLTMSIGSGNVHLHFLTVTVSSLIHLISRFEQGTLHLVLSFCSRRMIGSTPSLFLVYQVRCYPSSQHAQRPTEMALAGSIRSGSPQHNLPSTQSECQQQSR